MTKADSLMSFELKSEFETSKLYGAKCRFTSAGGAQFQLQLYAGILERAELGILCRLCHYEASIGGGHDGKLLSKMGISQAYIGPLVLWWAGKSGVVGTVTMSSQYGKISLCFGTRGFVLSTWYIYQSFIECS